MRQEADLSTDILGNGDLALAGDLNSNISTGKGNTIPGLPPAGLIEAGPDEHEV